MKIGKLVGRAAPAIFDYCQTKDPSEFARLQDADYSKKTLDINYPFCRDVTRIAAADHVRYYRLTHLCHGVTVRVTSQWFTPPTSKSLPLLQQYLTRLGISMAEVEAAAAKVPDSGPVTPRAPRGRYRKPAIGVAQNALIRSILSQIGEESFNADDWERVLTEFDNRCAYCGTTGKLVMDHVIPINRTSLGEHRLGNLVPSCDPCNSAKGQQDHLEFLENDPDRRAVIEAHMAKYDYVPIGENAQLQTLMQLAHDDLRQLADRYAQLVETLLPAKTETSGPLT